MELEKKKIVFCNKTLMVELIIAAIPKTVTHNTCV